MRIYDFAEIQLIVEAFTQKIPKLLAEHSATADLVSRVINLDQQASSPFTLAIVGQMRVGKSSLINALLEKDLAQTGVTETTATINWIRHGEDPSVVRVHWKDKPPETIAFDELREWAGESEKAASTRFIELFDDADFLKIASIVDTPGLRSVICSHEDATNEFLGLKLDSESRQLGSQADAIVYVMMPVAREKDDSFLNSFRDQTQLPGASSFNSLAVLHKWETIDADDPVAISKAKAERIANALSDSVSCVIPVSAPLARAAQSLQDIHWKTIIELASSPADSLEILLLSDQFFADEMPECSVPVSDRKELLKLGLPWPSLRFIVTLAVNERPISAVHLKTSVRSIAQIDFLRAELDRRFFARSRTLKLLSTVAKAWEPCRLAEIRLRNKKKDVGDLLVNTDHLLSILADRIDAGDNDLPAVHHYVSVTRDALRREHASLSSVLKEISHDASLLKTIYENLSGDLAGLEWLCSAASQDFPEAFRSTLACLLGQDGVSAEQRVARLNAGAHSNLDSVEKMIDEVNKLKNRSKGEARAVLNHAAERLEQLANHFDGM